MYFPIYIELGRQPVKATFAGMFIVIGMLFTAAVANLMWPNLGWAWLSIVVLLPAFYGLTALSIVLFYLRDAPSKSHLPLEPADRALRLDNSGLLESKNFESRRALLIEEVDCEGSQYFIELKNGRVLYLRGQYLYDYEASGKDEPRKFPTSFFTMRRHRERGFVVDILRHGDLIPVEVVVPAVRNRELKREITLQDGTLLASMTLEEIKADLIHSTTPSLLDAASEV